VLWAARGSARAGKESAERPWVHPKETAKRGPISIHHQGAGDNGTDAWWRRGKLSRVRAWCKSVRDAGVLVAVTSHRPEVFMEIGYPTECNSEWYGGSSIRVS
jgi:hypothetical protein